MTSTGAPPEAAPSPLVSLFGNGLAYSVATAIQAATALLVLPAVTRLVRDANEFGTIAAALVVLQLVSTFAALGLPAAITREYFDSAGTRQVAARLVGSTGLLALTIALVVHLSGPWWSRAFENLEYDGPLVWAVVAVVPTSILSASQALLRCRERPTAFVVSTVVGTAGAQILGLTLVYLGDGSASEFFVGFFAGVTLGALLAVRASGFASLRPAPAGTLMSALRLSVPSLPHSFALLLILAADRIVVERFEGLAAAGSYQLTYVIGAAGVSLLVAVNNAWVPLVYNIEDDGKRWAALAETTESLSRFGFLIVSGLAFGAPWFLRLAAPPSLDQETLNSVLVVTSLTIVPYTMYLAASMVIFYERRTGLLAVITPTAAALNLTANLFVVPRAGLLGAAVVSLLSYVFLAALSLSASSTLARVPWRKRSHRRTAAAAMVVVLSALIIPTDGTSWLLLRAVVMVVSGVALAFGVRRTLIKADP